MRDDFSGGPGAANLSKTHARARYPETNSSWRLEPHVCRVCFSRIASVAAGEDRREYRCTNCDLTAVGGKPSSLCACGLKMRKGGKNGTTGAMTDLGIRCHLNAARSAEFPALYVASFAGAQEDGV